MPYDNFTVSNKKLHPFQVNVTTQLFNERVFGLKRLFSLKKSYPFETC